MAKPDALRRRIVPAIPLTLELADDSGATIQRTFRLSFDFNAFSLIHEKTGLDMTGLRAWGRLNPSTLSVLFWAAVLAHTPEYAGDEGLGIIRSYMDVGNEDKIGAALFEAYAAALPPDQRKILLDAKAAAEQAAEAKRLRELRGEPEPEPDPSLPLAETAKPAATNP